MANVNHREFTRTVWSHWVGRLTELKGNLYTRLGMTQNQGSRNISISGMTWLQMPAAFSYLSLSLSLFKRYMCIFIYGCAGSLLLHVNFSLAEGAGLLSSWGAQASRCRAFSCCGAGAAGYAGFSSCCSWAPGLRLRSSGARVRWATARGIFPDQGSNVCLLHWQVDSLSLGHQGSPCLSFYQWLKSISLCPASFCTPRPNWRKWRKPLDHSGMT